MPLDLTLSPLYRIDGQEQASLPGLMPAMPPRKTARGREQDRLVVYLLLNGSAVFSTGEYMQLASRAAVTFYETSGTLTNALRAAAEAINQPLLERNTSTSGQGQYTVGLLSLVALRESQATLLLSGPMHAYILNPDGAHHIFDSLSGNGLGLGAKAPHHFSRISLQPNDRLVLCAKIPYAWESALNDSSPASLETTRRRLMNLSSDNVNAVLIQATEGNGALNVLRPTEIKRIRRICHSASSRRLRSGSLSRKLSPGPKRISCNHRPMPLRLNRRKKNFRHNPLSRIFYLHYRACNLWSRRQYRRRKKSQLSLSRSKNRQLREHHEGVGRQKQLSAVCNSGVEAVNEWGRVCNPFCRVFSPARKNHPILNCHRTS